MKPLPKRTDRGPLIVETPAGPLYADDTYGEGFNPPKPDDPLMQAIRQGIAEDKAKAGKS
jgi:hypothetical protein